MQQQQNDHRVHLIRKLSLVAKRTRKLRQKIALRLNNSKWVISVCARMHTNERNQSVCQIIYATRRKSSLVESAAVESSPHISSASAWILAIKVPNCKWKRTAHSAQHHYNWRKNEREGGKGTSARHEYKIYCDAKTLWMKRQKKTEFIKTVIIVV